MSYCSPGADSDVHAYFHRMGYCVCDTCQETFQSKTGLKYHLIEQHRDRGDRVPQAAIDRLDKEIGNT